ncbi:hypothetical protein [Marinicrinis lubricantis]|uniref:Uncharacterized protein n=1 Tax=Marinicrinis lubricantis TaxID=2086470 RepID=A0ABW1IL98_9BACL
MTKSRILIITAVTETICMLLTFLLTYFSKAFDWKECILMSLFVSLISGTAMYMYLIRTYGLDFWPWKQSDE